jgi:hypothetical protein
MKMILVKTGYNWFTVPFSLEALDLILTMQPVTVNINYSSKIESVEKSTDDTTVFIIDSTMIKKSVSVEIEEKRKLRDKLAEEIDAIENAKI